MFKHATLNRAYRLVWSELRNTWVAVAEFSRTRGKRTAGVLVAGTLLALGAGAAIAAGAPAATALPTGGQVAAGQVGISSSGARMDVTQSSASAIVNWDSFNIGSQAHVNFAQPDASSVILNRVLGGDGSAIFGRMTANGQVFITNPSGILFAPGAQVDVGGLVASSLGISDANFLAKNYQFERVGAGGTVVNQGTLTAANGGFVALIAPQVGNSGSITATGGSVGLAAGDSVNLDFDHDGLLSFKVNLAAAAARADNSGIIVADGGRVVMNVQARDALLSTVLNNDGLIRARSLESRNGEIWLGGGNSGVVSVSGTLDASGAATGQTGGTVKVLGDKVGLFDQAQIDVSGVGAGGTALVGGNWQGKGTEQNASASYVGKDVNINADALGTGDGGKVVVWANGTTHYQGRVSAKGGEQGGNGGFVEVSGKRNLEFTGNVDTRAPMGQTGTLLLDPTSINIISGGTGASTVTCTGTNCTTFGAGPFTDSGTGNLTDGTLNAQLAINNVLVTATDDIVVNATAAIDLKANGLTLTSTAGGITFGATTIAATGGGTLGLNFVTTLDFTAGPNFSAVTTVSANGGGTGTIAGPNVATTWTISAANSGSLAYATGNTVGFSNTSTLKAGTAGDTFNLTTGSMTTITGGAGTDVLSTAGAGGSKTVTLTGTGAGSVDTTAATGFSSIETYTGSGTDSFSGPATGTTFVLSGANAGSAAGIAFTGIANLTGGSGSDTFTGGGGSISGVLADPTGITTLNGALTAGSVSIGGAVTLGSNTTVATGVGNISFGSTVDGGFTLDANSSGSTTFGGPVGGNTPLAALATDALGTTVLNGGLVKTTGAQTYGDAVSAGTVTLTTTGGGAITAVDAGNDFGTLSLNGVNATIRDSNGVALGTSNLTGYLDLNSGGGVGQTGALTIGSDLWVMSSGDILFKTLNTLGGSVSLIAGAGREVWLNSSRIAVGTMRPSDSSTTNVGISAANVTLEAPGGGAFITTGAEGLITASAPFSATPALKIIANGAIGDPGAPTTKGLRVQTSGLVQVVGNAVGDGTIYLMGEEAIQPKYEFSGDPTHRSVKYNGVEAANAQLTGALDAAYLDIRNQTTEIRESGFAKENASKVLRRGVVTSAGPGQPAVDDSTGLAGMEQCDGSFGDGRLTCQ